MSIQLKKWEKAELSRERARLTAYMYAQLIVARGSQRHLTYEDWQLLGNLYKPSAKKPAYFVRMFLKSRVGSMMTAEQLARILAEKGVTPDKVIEDYMELKETAMMEGKLSVAKGVLDQMAKFLGLDSVFKAQQEIQAHNPAYAHLLTVIEEENPKLLGDADTEADTGGEKEG